MKDTPVIESLLDIDFYKLSMGQMIFHKHPKVPVKFSFINRSKPVFLAKSIDLGILREELEHCRQLRFRSQDLHYIMGTYEYGKPMFQFDYIDFLKNLKLPEFQLSEHDGQISLNFNGSWAEVTYWETLSMSIVSELYYRALMKNFSKFESEQVEARGRLRLANKLQKLTGHPEVYFSDFGTRRRFSRAWQDYVVGVLSQECPYRFKGTSNVALASKYGVTPVGTNAHELPMIYSGIYWDDDTVEPTCSHRHVLRDWEEEYGLGLSLFLPDTCGSDWFFEKVVDKEMLRRWKGSRQDSGIPLEYAEKRISEYTSSGINPKEKLIVFADGLNADKMIEIGNKLEGRVQYTFGWGTDLTNDLGFAPISIVVKPTEANGHEVAKLTDNVAKATGSPEAVSRMKQLAGYSSTFSELCHS